MGAKGVAPMSAKPSRAGAMTKKDEALGAKKKPTISMDNKTPLGE